MGNIIKFSDGNKELFIFEWDGKIATIAPELIAFEGYKDVTSSWRDIKNREEFEQNYEYKTLQGEELKVFKDFLKHSQDLSLVVGDLPKTLYDQYKSVPRLDIVFEEGIYGVMYSSNSGHANKFKKFMRREVNPQLQRTGSFDIVKHEISKIEDEKEKSLRMKIKMYEDILKVDPSDLVAINQLNHFKLELSQYLHSKELQEVRNEVKQIEDRLAKTTVLREGDMSPEAVAKRFNVFSTSNRPHNLFAENIARDLGIYIDPQGNAGYQDEYISINLTDKGGQTVPEVKYSKKAIKLMEKHINENGLQLGEPEYFKKGSRKGQFNFAYMYFENGRRIKVNEATYNLYK
jgi:prophage antirepressor-like protein